MRTFLAVLVCGFAVFPFPLLAGGDGGTPQNILSPNPITSHMRQKGEQNIVIPSHTKSTEEPLVLMLQRNSIDYQIAVHGLAQKALARNPEAQFRILSFIPATNHGATDSDAVLAAEENIEKILDIFDHLQIPRERVQVSYQRDAGLVLNRVQISVIN